MAAAHPGRGCGRPPDQRVVPVAEPEQAQPGGQPEVARGPGDRAGTGPAQRGVPAELPPGRGRAARHGLRVHPGRAPGHRVRVDLRLRRERPVREPAGPGHAAPGDERGDVQRGPGQRPARARGHLRGGRDHRVRGVRGGTGRPAAPGAHRRGPAGHGQHAGLRDRGAGPGAVHLHGGRDPAAPRGRGARPRLYPRALRDVRDRGRVPGPGLPAAGPAGRAARHSRVRRDGRRRGRAQQAGRDHRAGPGPAAGAHYRRVAGRVRRARHLGRPGVRLRRRGRRPAGAAQRLAGQLRPPDRGTGHHARLPVPLQRHPAAGVPGRAAGRGADPGDPGRTGLRRRVGRPAGAGGVVAAPARAAGTPAAPGPAAHPGEIS